MALIDRVIMISWLLLIAPDCWLAMLLCHENGIPERCPFHPSGHDL
jgi:hypothetical protein